MQEIFKNKRVLVTGACGTVGSELIKQLLTDASYAPQEIVGLDNNETELFYLDQAYLDYPHVQFFVADIRDQEELARKFRGVHVVFHAAALKHVILCERSPEQVLLTNINGVQNVIAAANTNNVETVIFTSSDKAVNPTNVMGTSKLMGERLMTAANSNKLGQGPIFASTRFGNVLGSSGSVIPIFYNQIVKGGPVTITDWQMTRFVMSISEAVRLVLDSAQKVRGGEVFITKMPVMRIVDLARAMIEELASQKGMDPEKIEMKEIGTKPGEKLYEELMSQEETRRALELKNYFSVLPAFKGIYCDIDYGYSDTLTTEVKKPYVSNLEDPLKIDQIKKFLRDNTLLRTPHEQTDRRYWPGDKEEKK